MDRALADIVVAIHLLALLFIGFGGFLAWRWPKVIFAHVFFAIWGVVVNVFPVPCPLTALENHFRHLQGLTDLPGGFNSYYLYGTIFPRSMLPLVGVVAIAVVGVSYYGTYYHWKHRDSAPTHRVSMG